MEGPKQIRSSRPIPSHQVHLEVKGKGSFLRCRAEQGREEGRQRAASTSIISIRKTVTYEWRFSSLSKSLYLTHHNSICTHLKWRLCMCETLFTQSADNTWCSFCPQAPLTVTPGPSRDCGLLHGGLLHKETKHFWWANPLLAKVSVHYCF